MPVKSSVHQASFLSGQFSPFAQGRSDIPQYKQAMSISLNGFPVEEGAWVRRSGFEFIVPTRSRQYANILPFDGSATCAFGMVFTPYNLQFVSQSSLIFDSTIDYPDTPTITNSSFNAGSGAVVIDISVAQPTWVAGDQVMIVFPDTNTTGLNYVLYPYPADLECGLRGRLLTINFANSDTEFVLGNDLGVSLGLDPSFSGLVAGGLIGAQIGRVLNLSTPYGTIEEVANLRAIQVEYQSVILSASVTPYVVDITSQPTVGPVGADPVFDITPLTLIDGPYLDPSGDTGTISAYTGGSTFTATATTPFVPTDVGRLLRLFSQPALWNAGTAYVVGNQVTDDSGAWWTAIIDNTDVYPGNPTVVAGVQQIAWAPAPFAGSWAWGIINAYVSSSEVTFNYQPEVVDPTDGVTNIGAFGSLQVDNGTLVTTFQLGVYTDATVPVYPTCGTYHQGRLYFGGAVANRFDASASNGVSQQTLATVIFSPTDGYGNVLDSSAMAETFNSKYINQIQWMAPSPLGIVMGTLSGEFLVSASAQNDPITPTDIQSWMATKYGSAFVEPVQAGMAMVYVQKFGQRVMEYLADAFSQKFSGRHLNEWAKDLTTHGVARLAYQEETFPCVWALTNDGVLAGCTYRRYSRFVQEPPNVEGWHWHLHGRRRPISSMAVVPGKSGLLDRLYVITNDPTPQNQNTAPLSNYFIEVMQPFFDQGDTILDGWLCDEAPGPGPGADPAYDCGGGNAFLFAPTGATAGFDSTVPDMAGVFPYATNPPVGTPLSLGLNLNEIAPASFFDGNTALYNLPAFPSPGAQADEVSLSLSVWVASEDFGSVGAQSGALLWSPGLSFGEAESNETIVTSIIGGASSLNPGQSILARVSTGLPAYPDIATEVDDGQALGGGQVWNNLLISVKGSSASGGEITVLAYLNETLICNTTAGTTGYGAAIWPFLTQPGAQKDNGLAVWTIGGVMAASGGYDVSDTYSTVSSPPGTLTPLTLNQILNDFFKGGGVGIGTNTVSPSVLLALENQQLLAQQPDTRIVQSATGLGIGNIPFDQPDGSVSGYRGSVAELWIKPGTFIDWTNATNRAHMHSFSVTLGQYVPLSLGSSGGGTALGSPWIYLSGPPNLWNLNRANGTRLTVSGAIIDSPLQPPGSTGS